MLLAYNGEIEGEGRGDVEFECEVQFYYCSESTQTTRKGGN